MSAERLRARCVDCGTEVPTLCTHVMARIFDPVTAFQGKVISELQDERDALRASNAALEARCAGLAVLVGELWDAAVTFDAAFALCESAHQDLSCEPMHRDVERCRAIMRKIGESDDKRAAEVGAAVRKMFDATVAYLEASDPEPRVKVVTAWIEAVDAYRAALAPEPGCGEGVRA